MLDSGINCNKNWIVDFGCSNHVTSDKENLVSMVEYKGGRVDVMANNSKLLITYVRKFVIVPRLSSQYVKLQNVSHVPGMKNFFFWYHNLLPLTTMWYLDQKMSKCTAI